MVDVRKGGRSSLTRIEWKPKSAGAHTEKVLALSCVMFFLTCGRFRAWSFVVEEYQLLDVGREQLADGGSVAHAIIWKTHIPNAAGIIHINHSWGADG